MKIKNKLLLGFLLIVLLISIFGIYSWRHNHRINHKVNFMRQGSMQEVVFVSQLSNSLHNSYAALQEMLEEALRERLLEGTEGTEGTEENNTQNEILLAKHKIERAINTAIKHLALLREATESSIILAEKVDDENLEKNEQDELIEWHASMVLAVDEYQRSIQILLSAIQQQELYNAADILEERIEPLFREQLLPLVDNFLADSMDELDKESTSIIQTTQMMAGIMGWTLAAIVLTAITISLFLARLIAEPLVRLSSAAADIQKGQTVIPFLPHSSDEIGNLTTIFFDMVATEQQQRKEIHANHNQLEKQNQILESEVERRTTALTISNKQLAEEIHKQKKTEQELSESLQEKETLLKEIHHRVKNNLQIITSLLRLQSGQTDDETSKRTLIESETRIRSMAMVHEKLYQSDTLSSIDLGGYIDSLSRYLMQTYNTGNVKLNLQVSPIMVLLDTAIPCGLILNELVTNVLKHAFATDQNGELSISLAATTAGDVLLEVTDDGKGLPPGFDSAHSESLGLQLLHSLSEQLDAEVTIKSEHGTSISLVVPSNHRGEHNAARKDLDR